MHAPRPEAAKRNRTHAIAVSNVRRVSLYAARIPWLGWVAWHHWFVIDRVGQLDRWEVWQRPAVGGRAWGHLHCNLLPPDAGVGAGRGWTVATWRGAVAATLAGRILASPAQYPALGHYRYWPGPNSNTYVQWILADIHRLGWRAPGRRWADRLAPAGKARAA